MQLSDWVEQLKAQNARDHDVLVRINGTSRGGMSHMALMLTLSLDEDEVFD